MMTAVIAGDGVPRGALCVLGAGNGNDLDLDALAASVGEIVLVDVDRSALDRAFTRAGPALRRKLTLAGPIDVSGLLDRPLRWTPQDGAGRLAEELRAAALSVVDALPRAAFDLVVSGCVLSQMNQNLAVSLGTARVGLRAILDGVAVAHLELLGALLEPGGRAVLATDVLSSDEIALDGASGADLDADLLAQVAARSDCYPGTGPAFLLAALRRHAPLRALFDRHRVSRPWIWEAMRERRYLVYALDLRRAAPSVGGGAAG
jgi:hypothetical protein